MTRLLIAFITFFLCISAYAQNEIIVGDMNDDGELTVGDVTELTNTIIGLTPMKRISKDNINLTDKRSIVGSWATEKGKLWKFNEDGTLEGWYAGMEYIYYPSANDLVIYSSSDSHYIHYCRVFIINDTLYMGGVYTSANDDHLHKISNLVTGIDISEQSITMACGEEYQLSHTVMPEDATLKNCEWSSSNWQVASVDAQGLVKSIDKGTAIITVKTTDGTNLSASCEVTVIGAESIVISPEKIVLHKGENIVASAKVIPDDANQQVQWSIDDNSIAIVARDGEVTALKAGKTILRAASVYGTKVYGECEIEVLQYVEDITLSQQSLTLGIGAITQLKMNVMPEDASDKRIKWSSDNPQVAQVSEGTIVVTGAGFANITATAEDGSNISASCQIIGLPLAPSAITISESQMVLSLGDEYSKTLTASITPIETSAMSMEWSSSNEKVATVDSNGNVVAHNVGTANIYAKVTGMPQISASCEVTVDCACIDLGLPSGTVWASCNLGGKKSIDTGDYYSWGSISPQDTYSWTTYRYGTLKSLSKYNSNNSYGNVDNMLELDPEDDAAYINWGSDWRMPSIKQMQELLEECDISWITQEGCAGCLLTSRRNSNSLFLPMAGYYSGTTFQGAGTSGAYWISSLDEENPSRAFILYFYQNMISTEYVNERCAGHPIRPVRANSR